MHFFTPGIMLNLICDALWYNLKLLCFTTKVHKEIHEASQKNTLQSFILNH